MEIGRLKIETKITGLLKYLKNRSDNIGLYKRDNTVSVDWKISRNNPILVTEQHVRISECNNFKEYSKICADDDNNFKDNINRSKAKGMVLYRYHGYSMKYMKLVTNFDHYC